jgi:hypothetical protein
MRLLTLVLSRGASYPPVDFGFILPGQDKLDFVLRRMISCEKSSLSF